MQRNHIYILLQLINHYFFAIGKEPIFNLQWIFLHYIQTNRWIPLGKVIKNGKVSPRNTIWQADIEDQLYNHGILVLWCWFCGTCRHEKSHGRCINQGYRINTNSLNEAEDQYREFYRIRIGSRKLCVITFVMDQYCDTTLNQNNTGKILSETNGLQR